MNKISVTSKNGFLELLSIEKKVKFLFPESLILHDGSIYSWISLIDESIILNETDNMNLKEIFYRMSKNKNKNAKRRNASITNFFQYTSNESNENLNRELINYVVRMKNGEIIKTNQYETSRVIEEKSVFTFYGFGLSLLL